MPSGIAAAVAAPVAGAVVGKVLGGGKQKSSSSTTPVLPDNFQAGYDQLLGMAQGQVGTPFEPTPGMRVAAPSNAYEALFTPPELLELQKQSDINHYTQRSMGLSDKAMKGKKLYDAQDFSAFGTNFAPQDYTRLYDAAGTGWNGLSKNSFLEALIDHPKRQINELGVRGL